MNERLELVRPTLEFAGPFLEWAREEVESDPRMRGVWPTDEAELAAHIERCRAEEAQAVPQFAFWLLRDGKDVVGSSRMRTQLAPDMVGGHIDYGIRATEQRKGYGTRQLALLKDEARRCGLARLLVTCRANNEGSIGVILKNGGVFGEAVVNPNSGQAINRYWIDLS
jgi:predicted acetyltransferase